MLQKIPNNRPHSQVRINLIPEREMGIPIVILGAAIGAANDNSGGVAKF